MAETLTVNTDESTAELTAEEQDSLQVGEQMAEEQGKLLAGKYKNCRRSRKAYVELQKNLETRWHIRRRQEPKSNRRVSK